MEQKLLISAKTKEGFKLSLSNNKISFYLVAFIQDTKEIWTLGMYYPCPYSLEEILNFILELLELDNLLNQTIENRSSQIIELITQETLRATNKERSLELLINKSNADLLKALDSKLDKNTVYTKELINEKLSGIYKVKGSRTFEELPIEGNSVGDVYNITNLFILNEKKYDLGTNVVWTEEGWDALAGIFDISELEEDIQEVKDNCLTVVGRLDVLSEKTFKANAIFAPFNRTSTFSLIFRPLNKEDMYLTYSNEELKFGGANSLSKIYHEGNFNPSNYLPLSGGTLTGDLKFELYSTGLSSCGTQSIFPSSISRGIHDTSGNVYDKYYNDKVTATNTYANLIVKSSTSSKILKFGGDGSFSWDGNKVWHEGNDGPNSGLDADTLDGVQLLNVMHNNFDNDGKTDTTAGNQIIRVKGSFETPCDLYKYGDILQWTGRPNYSTDFDNLGNFYHLLYSDTSSKSNLYHRTKVGSANWTKWRAIAFTDYNGFYDLYAGNKIPSGSDLNNYKTVGVFNTSSNSISATILNSPCLRSFKLCVESTIDNVVIKQKIEEYDTYTHWERCYYNSTGIWTNWSIVSTNLNTYNAPTATKASQDSEGNVITDTYALKSDLIIGLNITDGVYAVKADGALCTIDEADTSCTGVALIAGEHKFMIAKTDATDGTNTTLYWGNKLEGKDVTGITNTSGSGYIGEGQKYGTDFTTWSSGPVTDFNGKANTAAIIAAYTEHGVSMGTRDMCSVLNTFNQAEQTAGRSAEWYVPACGQVALMYLNMTEINAALAKIGGTAIASNYYWSSSEYDSDRGWRVAFDLGLVGYDGKYYTRRVRFIRDIQVKSLKSSVKESITEIKDQLKQPAKSALKLATPVKLWGNNFDGSGNVNGVLQMYDANNNPVIKFHNGEYIDGYGNFNIGDDSSWHLNSNSLNILTIKGTGNVGIGINTPGHKLHVEGNAALTESLNFTRDNWAYITVPENNGNLSFNVGVAGTAKTKMCILNNGNVGIGTINPKSKFVISTISTELNPSMGDLAKSYTICFKAGGYYGTYFWTNSSGVGNIQVGREDGNPTAYDLKLQPLDGRVSIGQITPEYRLSVEGSIHSTNGVVINNDAHISSKDANNNALSLLTLNSNNKLIIGNGTSASGYSTFIDGKSIVLRTNIYNNPAVYVNVHENVTIGNSDKASIYHKLFVDGSTRTDSIYCVGNAVFGANTNGIYIKNDTIMMHDSNNVYTTDAVVFTELGDADFKHNLGVSYKITSGDYVDWYGVSWSEDSSDPTCTRIGNMALHRSLPIQSAMKGYIITTKSANFADGVLPLDDDWSETVYGLTNNDKTVVAAVGRSANIMVKIPEFWYTDNYEPSTKTHNLKISQTAKAGWCHHKEAYVGAYEGYHDDILYRSSYGIIPTVSKTREQLRTAARANGYEDEYKWNIYTYEEHRAICHLFLVEYATRNSQAPVNTALTADGFKQGGLGSGCTTGTVKINGVDTYSFIPTGTTDSLGNGSGQVAYTVMLTDADGNEIGTVTRYANRYRGIENPFGHIWKHVDDIVNVYNAESGNKTVYKCNKPEHFATNKNAKYKPLCSFPGGSKMQGWSKEIKATINCDFFKYSVGGSESTYWCDYNYDSDNTSEHCLLIGGDSVYGGGAGLFYFTLDSGVGNSYVSIGSRLTYLPWAE